MKSFHLDIITPSRQAFSKEVEAIYAPTPDGTVGVLAHHMPLFTSLIEGEVRILSENKEYFLAIGGGFMEVSGNKATILVSRAVHADEINEDDIARAKKEAEEIIARQKEGAQRQEAQAILRRSIIEFSVLKHRKTRTRSSLS